MISELMKTMIDYSGGSRRDIAHFLKVWGYARTIGTLEGLDDNTQTVLEAAAILHDIACPLLRAKTGATDWRQQEILGAPMARDLLKSSDLTEAQQERVVYLVGHHHTVTDVDGLDYRILLEADFLVNADEGSRTTEQILAAKDKFFRTASGTALLNSIYGV